MPFVPLTRCMILDVTALSKHQFFSHFKNVNNTTYSVQMQQYLQNS